MKYPRNPKDAERAIEKYRLSLIEELPLITVNLKNFISSDKDEAELMDVMLIDGTPCESPLVCVKSMAFNLYDPANENLEINTTYIDVKDFLSAADTINTFIYTRREIDEIL